MITVNEKLCKGCNLCTEFCPRKVYKESKELNKKGIHVPTPVDEEKCTKCGLCVLMCPDQAIKVEEEEQDE
ncbi:MAG TPA: ferredoxin family protein [Methanobacterium sp.]